LTCNVALCAFLARAQKKGWCPLHDLMQQMLADYISACRPLFAPTGNQLFVNRSGRALTRQYVWKNG
jgi:Site-specific recombinase XerD